MNKIEKTFWNRILLMLVVILLVLAIFILSKIAFFPFGFDTKDWGTRSDLLSSISTAISALGTLGTLAVAYAAYRKAPEWMAQKHYDVVSRIIEEAIYEDLRKLSSLSNQYKIYIVHTCNTIKNCLKTKDELPKGIEDTLDKVENLLIEFFNLSYSIQNRLKAIPRYNYIITPYTLNIIDNIKHSADSYNQLQTQFELAASEIPMLMYADEEAISIMKKEVIDIQLKAIEINNNLKDFVKSIYDDNKLITDFINVIK